MCLWLQNANRHTHTVFRPTPAPITCFHDCLPPLQFLSLSPPHPHRHHLVRRRKVVARCKPNAGHYSLAAAEHQARQRGVEFTVVTQNIDRLHQAASSSNVVEMHGSLW